jgi:hypothetical protein
LLPDFNQIWSFPQIFVRVSSIKFHENRPIETRADTCGRTARRTNKMILLVVSCHLHERAEKA